MNFNLVEMYNGLLRFNKHILNELAEGLKHLPNLDGVSKGDSLTDGFITEFDFRFGPYFVPNKVGTNKKADYNSKKVVMGKIQIKLFVCFCLAVALITVLRLALVSFILIGFGQVLLLMSASLLQLNLIK